MPIDFGNLQMFTDFSFLSSLLTSLIVLMSSKPCFQSRKVTLGSLGKVSGADILGETMFVLLCKVGLVAGYGGDGLGAYGRGVEGYGTYDGPGIGGVYESGSGVGSSISQS